MANATLTRTGFGGKIVEIPDDFAEARYVSKALKLSLHRLKETETIHVNNEPQTRIIPKDPIQFVEGLFPGPGHELTPQEYAELETHPMRPKLFDRLEVPEVPTPPTTVESADTATLLEQLKERAASGDAEAQAAVDAMEPKTGGGTAESAPKRTAPKRSTSRKKTAKKAPAKKTTKAPPKETEADEEPDQEAADDGATTEGVQVENLTAAAEAVIQAGAEADALLVDGELDRAKILTAAEAHGVDLQGL
ncbi:MAG: hypothetical protein AAFQ43_00280 [Bacteroidota bacterium]